MGLSGFWFKLIQNFLDPLSKLYAKLLLIRLWNIPKVKVTGALNSILP